MHLKFVVAGRGDFCFLFIFYSLILYSSLFDFFYYLTSIRWRIKRTQDMKINRDQRRGASPRQNSAGRRCSRLWVLEAHQTISLRPPDRVCLTLSGRVLLRFTIAICEDTDFSQHSLTDPVPEASLAVDVSPCWAGAADLLPRNTTRNLRLTYSSDHLDSPTSISSADVP